MIPPSPAPPPFSLGAHKKGQGVVTGTPRRVESRRPVTRPWGAAQPCPAAARACLTCHPEAEAIGGLLPPRTPQHHSVEAAVSEAGRGDQELGEAILDGGHTSFRQGQAIL